MTFLPKQIPIKKMFTQSKSINSKKYGYIFLMQNIRDKEKIVHKKI